MSRRIAWAATLSAANLCTKYGHCRRRCLGVRVCTEHIIAAKACHVGERCGRYRKIYILAQTHVGLDQLFISCRRCGFALSESIKGFEGGVKQMVQFRTLLRGFRSYDLTLR